MKKYFAYSLTAIALLSAAAAYANEDAGRSNLNAHTVPAEKVQENRSFFDLFRGKDEVPAREPVTSAPAAAQPELLADAGAEVPVSLTNEQRELMRVQHYLNSLSTIVADFTQIAPDGGLTTGTFYLKRPGKIRWEYTPPTPILIIANGRNMVYYDKELEQVSHLPIDSTLAGFLAREKIDLNDPKLKVDSLTTAPGVLRLKLSQRNKPEEGSLMLELSDQPLQIRNMIITDAQKQVTTVSLTKARFGVPLENHLFVWKDPRRGR